jgi:hypothetical protein
LQEKDSTTQYLTTQYLTNDDCRTNKLNPENVVSGVLLNWFLSDPPESHIALNHMDDSMGLSRITQKEGKKMNKRLVRISGK